MQEIRVDSWDELLHALYAEAWNEPLARFRPMCAYRGCDDAASPLFTGLCRASPAAEQVEAHLLRAFRKYARESRLPDDTVWSWLALAQHHGLPTRLLDFTFSPLVALHFATDEPSTFARDGCVFRVDYGRTNRYLPPRLARQLEEEGASVFTTEMLAQAAASLSAFEALSPEPFVCFLEPPSLDDRIVNQFALFSLPSSPALPLDRLLEAQEALVRVIVPAELKWEVRDKLDQANVTERVLYPGLDGLCLWLRRYYGPR